VPVPIVFLPSHSCPTTQYSKSLTKAIKHSTDTECLKLQKTIKVQNTVGIVVGCFIACVMVANCIFRRRSLFARWRSAQPPRPPPLQPTYINTVYPQQPPPTTYAPQALPPQQMHQAYVSPLPQGSSSIGSGGMMPPAYYTAPMSATPASSSSLSSSGYMVTNPIGLPPGTYLA